MSEPLVRLTDLKKYFPIGFQKKDRQKVPRFVRAVDGVNLDIHPGETIGLVGESGCGKTTLGRTILLLQRPTSGSVFFDGEDITHSRGNQLRTLRKSMQIIFQDPYASLNPRRTVEQIVGLPLALHGTPPERIRPMVKHLLKKVGLQVSHIDRFPHQFSGGQRQRIGIARALAVNPRFIVADEPVSSLDVSIQAQIINLLEELRRDMGLTFLFITHDLSVVSYVSDRIAVMYLGKIVELARTEALFDHPLHPYTQALLSAIPRVDRRDGEKILLAGGVPSPADPPEGCRFRTRCFHPAKDQRCLIEPPLRTIDQSRLAACHFIEETETVSEDEMGCSIDGTWGNRLFDQGEAQEPFVAENPL